MIIIIIIIMIIITIIIIIMIIILIIIIIISSSSSGSSSGSSSSSSLHTPGANLGRLGQASMDISSLAVGEERRSGTRKRNDALNEASACPV